MVPVSPSANRSIHPDDEGRTFGKGAGCRRLGISNLLTEGWCLQITFLVLIGQCPLKNKEGGRREEEWNDHEKARKKYKKDTLATFGKQNVAQLFFLSKKIAGGNEHIKLRGETLSRWL